MSLRFIFQSTILLLASWFLFSCASTKRDNAEAPLALDIPKDWEYEMLPGEEYEVYEIRPKGGSQSTLGIYLGRNPQLRIANNTQAVTIPVGPEKKDTLFWQDSRGGKYVLQGVIDNFFLGTKDKNLAQQKMHIVVSAAEPGFSDTALDVLQTLRRADGVSVTARNSSNNVDPAAEKAALLGGVAAEPGAEFLNNQQEFEDSFRQQVQEVEGVKRGLEAPAMPDDMGVAMDPAMNSSAMQTQAYTQGQQSSILPVNETPAQSADVSGEAVIDQSAASVSRQVVEQVPNSGSNAVGGAGGGTSSEQLQRIREKISQLKALEQTQ